MSSTCTAHLFVLCLLTALRVAQIVFEPSVGNSTAVLIPENEVTPPTLGGATPSGTFQATLQRNAANQWYLAWTVSFQGLTSGVTGAHIHVGAPGTQGGVVVNFDSFGRAGQTSATSATGTTLVADATALALLQSTAQNPTYYINLHTATNGGGEIRGAFETTVGGLADPHFFGFDGTSFEVGSTSEAQGYVYNLISEDSLVFNSLMDRAPGPNRWPYWGTWMRAYGIKYEDVLEMELAFKPELELKEEWASGLNATRSVLPDGGYEAFMTAQLNGKDASAYIESGETLELGKGVAVHFPGTQQKHARDATDGPVVVVTTPIMQIVIYLETEEHAHFDFEIKLLKPDADMHGLLGQTIRWVGAKPTEKVIEGEERDYVVTSPIGTDFKHNKFRTAGKDNGRRLLGGVKVNALSVASSRSGLGYVHMARDEV